MTTPSLSTYAPAGATVKVLEAIGYGPDAEAATSLIRLIDGDRSSTQDVPLLRNSDGSPAVSTERWLRLLFEPPFSKIENLRFWCADYAPNGGWRALWGVATDYQKPTRATGVATRELPIVDGAYLGELHEVVPGSASMISDWLVLQSECTNSTGGSVLQDPGPHLTFAWTET